jgi:hypothetical protein
VSDSLISSFVVRIFKAEDGDAAADQNLWRVTVRQVQTDDERHFRTLDEAHAFMKSFVSARQDN